MKLTEVSRGIPHIEDLPIADFVQTIVDLDLYEATEKLDGAQILFGLDENGFYTSRETKGGTRIYNESEYDIRFPTTYMRAAHKLLEQVLPDLKAAGLRQGDQVEAEVLYGPLPNVVPYSEDINYLVFLRTTEGTVNIDRLKQKLCGNNLLVSLVEPYTADGRNIHLREQASEWSFARVPVYKNPFDNFSEVLTQQLASLHMYLKEMSSIHHLSNLTVENTPLNKRPDWCEPEDWKSVKEELRVEREVIRERLTSVKLEIKETLLDHLVRYQESHFGPSLEEGGWIEGVVLRHKDTGKMVKLVDKSTFGETRISAWHERNALTENVKGVDSKDRSFLGEIYYSMATAIGHPELGTMQAKNYLRKAGNLNEERIQNLSGYINTNGIKSYWTRLLERQEEKLEARLDKYVKENAYGVKTVERVPFAIFMRTMETYAETFSKIRTLRENTKRAETAEDLVKILVGKHLDEI